ncbi:MAG TPA: hypothetical protein EYQ50_08270 [Verrucomicrobiales bacterium]|nr:hypothetical protein [Verrucomicrobiales bacterium]
MNRQQLLPQLFQGRQRPPNNKGKPSFQTPLFILTIVTVASLFYPNSVLGQLTPEYESPPIYYSTTVVTNLANQVETRLRSGELQGIKEGGKVLLKSFLHAFDVPEETQVLVFSKTSLQRNIINPQNPRSIFYSDDTYFGWVPGGLYELTLFDPKLGLVFYAVDAEQRTIQRDNNCLSCHGSSRTDYWPGVLVRSVFPDEEGNPVSTAGDFVTGHESPLNERWGGWYVTGTHGDTRHMGNLTLNTKEGATSLDRQPGANLMELSSFFNVDHYLLPDSDIVALMVLEHQCEMHNRLSRGMLRVPKWINYQKHLYKSLGEPNPEKPTGSALIVLQSETDSILKHLLFHGEVQLTDGGIQGAGRFEPNFRNNRKEDAQGRSLKDFDLLSRLFKYRCSYMIYSKAFDYLPILLKKEIYKKLRHILSAKIAPKEYAYLPFSERRAILEILMATKPEFNELSR